MHTFVWVNNLLFSLSFPVIVTSFFNYLSATRCPPGFHQYMVETLTLKSSSATFEHLTNL